ncbi:hypothetical protein X738_32920 [Mesorhizobium sp. LNHC209A00]|nr:hypothetical protein X738_32920 [Mesorhizobium sp. LNHC209A00]
MTCIIFAMPRASLRSVLFGIVFMAALAARVSMQIAGRPSARNPSWSQDVVGAVVAQPLDRVGQPVDMAEAAFDGGDDEVGHVFALDALGGGDMGDGLAVAAVERESDAHLLAIVAAHLEAVGTPAQVRAVDGDPAVMAAFFKPSGVPIEKQAVPPS